MHLLATQRKLKFALLSNFVSSVMKLTQMTILAREPKWTIKAISVVTAWHRWSKQLYNSELYTWWHEFIFNVLLPC